MTSSAEEDVMNEEEEMEMMLTGEGSGDERVKKKHQNSVRWKRWWLKNREAYNEKRRLSAQMRSARNRANKERQDALSTAAPEAKRQRRSQSMQKPSASVPEREDLLRSPPSLASSSSSSSLTSGPFAGEVRFPTLSSNATSMPECQPSISPASGLRSILTPLPLLAAFSPRTSTVLGALNSPAQPQAMSEAWKVMPQSGSSSRMLAGPFVPPFQHSTHMANSFMYNQMGGMATTPTGATTPSFLVPNFNQPFPMMSMMSGQPMYLNH